jgi:hypothetical protein
MKLITSQIFHVIDEIDYIYLTNYCKIESTSQGTITHCKRVIDNAAFSIRSASLAYGQINIG